MAGPVLGFGGSLPRSITTAEQDEIFTGVFNRDNPNFLSSVCASSPDTAKGSEPHKEFPVNDRILSLADNAVKERTLNAGLRVREKDI